MKHHVTQYRTVTRLGATEWKKTCACGLSVQHPDSTVVAALYNAGHALDLGMDVTGELYETWLTREVTA